MTVWRTTFERMNFGFNPPLVQRADVAFETDIPFDNEHIGEFMSAAWDAMFAQNPHWKDPHGPIPGRPGWSSVMGGHKFERV